MHTIKFIREKGWSALTEELGIEIREYDNGFRVLNYSQIDSPKSHPVVLECRGLILDKYLNVIRRAFDRFFNFGEADTHDFDFENCTLLEKADGSLCPVYFNPIDNRWEIGTRGMAFAEGNHVFGLKTNWTFREAILDAMHFTEEEFQKCMNNFSVENTYIFEYCSPWNRIVTKYSEPKMVLLGVRSHLGHEFHGLDLRVWFNSLSICGMNARMPVEYETTSAEEVLKMVSELPDLQEGFVARENATGRRVKVKSSQYVLVHQMRGNGVPTLNSLLELVLKNEQAELLVHFPEFSQFVEPVELALKNLVIEATSVYNDNRHIESQKDFAMAVKDARVSSVCFKARKDGVSSSDAFDMMELNQKKNLLIRYVEESK